MSTHTHHYRDGKGKITEVPKLGETMDTCATISDKYICCNVKVLKSVANCPFDCSYCFLQNYLNDGRTKVINDIPAIMKEVIEKCEAQPWRLFRIGTWELGDSLALESQTGHAAALIKEFATLPNAILELKTKSDEVDSILPIDHQLKTVVSWSLNSRTIIDTEEHKTANLENRLDALKKVADAGYLVGAHFDPMIRHDGWKEEYEEVVKGIFEAAPPEQFAWISIGSLRFNAEMQGKMKNNFPGNKLLYNEMVKGDDGKLRYVKPHRVEMYQHLMDCLKVRWRQPVYLFMHGTLGYVGEINGLSAKKHRRSGLLLCRCHDQTLSNTKLADTTAS